jgi:hypothetical protein
MYSAPLGLAVMWGLGDSFTHTVAHCWLIAFHAARTRVRSPGLAFPEGLRIRSLARLGTGQVLCRALYGHGAVREALLLWIVASRTYDANGSGLGYYAVAIFWIVARP